MAKYALYGMPGTDDGSQTQIGVVEDVSLDLSLAESQVIRFRPIGTTPASIIDVSISGSGDADLHVAVDRQVTKSDFDCRPYFDGSAERCQLDAGSSFTILIDGFRESEITLNVRWIVPSAVR